MCSAGSGHSYHCICTHFHSGKTDQSVRTNSHVAEVDAIVVDLIKADEWVSEKKPKNIFLYYLHLAVISGV